MFVAAFGNFQIDGVFRRGNNTVAAERLIFGFGDAAVFGRTGIRLGSGLVSGFHSIYDAVKIADTDSGIHFGKLGKQLFFIALSKTAGYNDTF